MAHHDGLSTWITCVSTNMPHLTKPQATLLALWSFGIAITRTCGRRTVATFLGLLLEQKVDHIEQQLDAWCLDAPDKAGRTRTALDVPPWFVAMLAWIVRLWTGAPLALTRDATSLDDRLVVLVICVVDRGCALPVAWTILPAGQKRAWRCAWFRMLRLLRPAVPASWTVLVLADRGVSARWLFRRMVRLGWHPFLRINQGGTFRPAGQARCVWWSTLVGAAGRRWRGRGTDFASSDCRLDGTLAAWWGDGHAEPWCVLTDLDPDGCDAQWYAPRSWCEQRFTCTKRGGWQWQQTQMTDPARASRRWLALAVATLGMVTIGSDLEVAPPADTPDLPDLCAILGVRSARRPRAIRLFRLGWLWLLVRQIQGRPLPTPPSPDARTLARSSTIRHTTDTA